MWQTPMAPASISLAFTVPVDIIPLLVSLVLWRGLAPVAEVCSTCAWGGWGCWDITTTQQSQPGMDRTPTSSLLEVPRGIEPLLPTAGTCPPSTPRIGSSPSLPPFPVFGSPLKSTTCSLILVPGSASGRTQPRYFLHFFHSRHNILIIRK